MTPYVRFAPGAAAILLVMTSIKLVGEVVAGGAGLTAFLASGFLNVCGGGGGGFHRFTAISGFLALIGIGAFIPTFYMAAFYFRELRRPTLPRPPLAWWCVSVLFHAVAVGFSAFIVGGSSRIAGIEIPPWFWNALGIVISAAMSAACMSKSSPVIFSAAAQTDEREPGGRAV